MPQSSTTSKRMLRPRLAQVRRPNSDSRVPFASRRPCTSVERPAFRPSGCPLPPLVYHAPHPRADRHYRTPVCRPRERRRGHGRGHGSSRPTLPAPHRHRQPLRYRPGTPPHHRCRCAPRRAAASSTAASSTAAAASSFAAAVAVAITVCSRPSTTLTAVALD